MRRRPAGILLCLVTTAIAVGCEAPLATPAPEASFSAANARAALGDGPYAVPAPAWDIDALPDGGILVALSTTVAEIRRGGMGRGPPSPSSPVLPSTAWHRSAAASSSRRAADPTSPSAPGSGA
jgi:hypothetical protein